MFRRRLNILRNILHLEKNRQVLLAPFFFPALFAALSRLSFSELHANMLDAFYGKSVEINSPAYRSVRDGDPNDS